MNAMRRYRAQYLAHPHEYMYIHISRKAVFFLKLRTSKRICNRIQRVNADNITEEVWSKVEHSSDASRRGSVDDPCCHETAV